MAAFTLVAGLIAGVLVYATAVVIDGWGEAIVLGAILLTVVGAMIAVNPLRRR